MGRHWLSLSLLSLCLPAFCLLAMAGYDGVGPRNVTMEPSTRSIQVRWYPPSRDQSSLESYRVWFYSATQPNRKRVHWVPVETHPHEVISCLEPNTEYRVQVVTHFHPNSSISDANSDEVKVVTHPEKPLSFSDRLWQQRVAVLTGAVTMLTLVVLIAPCIGFCTVTKRRPRGHHRVDTSLPSAAQLQSPQTTQDTNNDPTRHSPDPTQGPAFRTCFPVGTPTNGRHPFAVAPPPSDPDSDNDQ
ncbi:uncharacterized protein LOC143294375 isoform X2 [Babylonia areolata]|uniref:uncharacterized protein LOC143294375 isoform X2 n=1 Tax=Babylonia areolata TaxID=304850 RepID=UPI003FD3DAF2